MVGLGGFAGSVCRYLISVVMQPLLPQEGIPWHTMLVNVVGSLLIGGLLAVEVRGHWHLLGVVGFCGGFTTFSTFSLDCFRLLHEGRTGSAAANAALNMVLGLGAAALGLSLFAGA